MRAIPKSVLKMLGRFWPHKDAAYHEPLRDWHTPIITNVYPSAARGKKFSADFDRMTELIADDVLINLSDDERQIVVDHQEQHALEFFCAEVYFAWSNYQARVKHLRLVRQQAEHRKHWADQQRAVTDRQQGILDRRTNGHRHDIP